MVGLFGLVEKKSLKAVDVVNASMIRGINKSGLCRQLTTGAGG